ncbi:tRNA pseudouridine synthase B [Linum perenne]
MVKSLSIFFFSIRPKPILPPFSAMATLSNPPILPTRHSLFSLSQTRFSSKTPYPLQYDMIISRPTQSSVALPRRHRPPTRVSDDHTSAPGPDPETGFEDWVDQKLSEDMEMDKSKRKYYNKRKKRMYGTDSEEEEFRKSSEESLVELKPEVVEFHRLHKREEELYFYDALAYPWEKDKHYKMVYQLEKKYFPDQCLDKAFLDPKDSNLTNQPKRNAVKSRVKIDDDVEGDKKLLFFEDGDDKKASVENVNEEVVTHKKVADFFKVLKKGPPGKVVEVGNGVEPFLATRTNGLPPTWDAPYGTVVLVNKPKGDILFRFLLRFSMRTGWTSFTVCGKLRRLVKVKKVGHAGTLDPMATGLLIVCVGKATKVVDSYQGMVKGYSGVFRLGEATSTWDADSPVIQREPWEQIKDNDIKKAAASFLGEIWQVPPMFSAIKVGGEKMYDKARRGESVELAPRRISIFQFDIERSLEDRQNLIFRVTCSKGTYIRSLCADLGKALGSCAHLTALRRDSIGEYLADDAWEFKELEDAIAKSYF